MGKVLPSTSMGRNGLPVATSACPSVHCRMSLGCASICEVGLDSGMMIGCGQWLCIVSTICWVNNPDLPDTPISTVGLALLTTSCSEGQSALKSQSVNDAL